MKLNILNGFTDWLQNVVDAFKDMEPLELFIIGLGVGVIIIILIYAFVAGHYRRKRLKTHKITINFDGGFYQGSCDELVITAKKGEKVDFTNVVPSKDGYQFNGFNFYKRFVASSITNKGITKDNITIEKYDGDKKDVIEMPDYDLYLVACYSEVRDDETIKLKSQIYYSDFLTIDDLIAELKHMNEDKKTYPDKINIVTSDMEPNLIFIFKDLTIVGFLKNVRGITKVFLRTSDEVDDNLLNPFYQAEDINDCYNWYSFIVMYNTKLSRFIRSFEESYKQIDCSHKTTSIEFNMICASLSKLADPVIDRTLMLVEKYEKDRLLDPQPEYVKNRDLPPNEEIVEKKGDDLTFEDQTNIILQNDIVGQDEKSDSGLNEVIMSSENELTDEKIKKVFGGNVDENKKEEDIINITNEIDNNVKEESGSYLNEKVNEFSEKVDVYSESLENETNENKIEKDDELKETKSNESASIENEINKSDENVNYEEIKNASTYGTFEDEHENQKVEIKNPFLNYDREKLIEIVMKNNEDKIELIKRDANKNSPYTLKVSNKTYAMIYENRVGLVRIIIRLDADTAKSYSKIHPNIIKSKFPMGFFWYQVYLDDTFYDETEINRLFNSSRIFTEKLIEQEEETKKVEE